MTGMSIQEKAARIRLLLMDVDGVLTDGKLINVPGPEGKMAETKACEDSGKCWRSD